MAGSSVTQTLEAFGPGRDMQVLTFDCVGDDTNGAIADTAVETVYMDALKGWLLGKIQTLFGATPPDDDTDLYLKDSNGIDILGGAGVNKIMAAVNKEFYPEIDGMPGTQPIIDDLTLDVDSQTAVDAIYTIKCFFTRPGS